MAPPPPEPSKDEIINLRATAKQKIDQTGASNFDERDLTRLYKDDDYIRRFLMHHDNDQKLALGMIMDTVQWRKENKVNDISQQNVKQEFFDLGSLYLHNRDIDGCLMLIFQVAKHQKGVHDMDELKRFLIYYLERLEREEYGKNITVFFDMQNTGMKNMDMEYIQYMINLFKSYYPWMLNYIIVFQMPWLLNAMWKIIKGWLPPKSIDLIKFVDGKSLKEYVIDNQALSAWGGTDSYQYVFEAEKTKPLPWLTADQGDAHRKVHFSDSTSDFIGDSRPKLAMSPNGGGLLTVTPTDEIVFEHTQVGASALISISNTSGGPVFFKVKTTSPDKFRVRPSLGALAAGANIGVTVTILATTGDSLPPAVLVREKFLVMSLSSSKDAASSTQIADAFKTASSSDALSEVRLRVGVSSSMLPTANGRAGGTSTDTQILNKLEEVLREQKRLQDQVTSGRRVLFISLALMVLVLAVLVSTTNSLSSSLLSVYSQGGPQSISKKAEDL